MLFLHLRCSVALSAKRPLSAVPLPNEWTPHRNSNIYQPIPSRVHFDEPRIIRIVSPPRNAAYGVFMVFHTTTYAQWRIFPHIRAPQVATMARQRISEHSRRARFYKIADNGGIITRNRTRNYDALYYDYCIFCAYIRRLLICREKNQNSQLTQHSNYQTNKPTNTFTHQKITKKVIKKFAD